MTKPSPPPSDVPTAVNASDSDGAGAVERVRQIVVRVEEHGALSRYVVGELLGKGGVGHVHAATDTLLRRDVALKRIRPDKGGDEVVRRFLLEAQVTGQLEHPNVVPVHDLGVAEDGTLFFSMRRVKGRSLAELVRAGQTGSLAQRLQVFLKVCDAVGYAHSRGVVHRDLKPGNVMVGDHGDVVVLDWGLAKVVDDDATSLGGRPVTADVSEEGEITSDTSVVGTPAYMPPEQALGLPIDQRTDVYALGGVLYALFTGRPPFDPGPDLLVRVREGRFKRPRAIARELPRELEAIVLKAMARVPTERYRDVAALKADVEAWLDGREVSAHGYRPWSRVAKWAWRNRRTLAPVVAVLVLATGAILLSTALYAVAAIRSRDRALAAERAAEVRLAEGEVALGLALADQGRVQDARERLRHARVRLAELGEPTTRARVAASWVEHRYPRPLLAWDGPGAVRISPDGGRVLLAAGSSAWLVSVPDGATLAHLDLPGTPSAPLFLGDRPVGAWRTPGEWHLADVVTGEPIATLPSSEEVAPAGFLASDRDGRRVLLSDAGGAAVHVVGAATPGVPIDGWVTGASPGLALAWGRPREPGSELRAPSVIVVWDAATGDERWRGPWEDSLILDDEGRALRLRDGLLELRDGVEGAVVWTATAEAGDRAGFARAGEVLQVGERRARWLDPATGRVVRELPAHGALSYTAGSFDAPTDGGVLVAGTGQRAQLFAPARDVTVRPVGGEPTAVEVSHDGVLAAVADAAGRVAILDAATGAEILSVPPPPAPAGREGVRDVAFSSDGRALCAADRTGAVRVIDLVAREVARTLPPRASAGRAPIAMAVEVLPDGRIAVVYEDGLLALWAADDAVRTVQSGLASAWDLAQVPARGWLVVSGRVPGPAFAVVDPASGRAVLQEGAADQAWYRLAVVGDRVAVGNQGGRVGVWTLGADLRAVPLVTLDTGPEVVMSVALAPDGRTLASGAYDGRVQLWDVDAGVELVSLRAHDGAVTDLAFSPDGARLLSAAGGLGVLELDLAERLDAWLPTLAPGAPVGDPGARLRDLGEAALLRGDPAGAAGLFARARAAGAAVPPLSEARALWAAGRRDAARAALDRAGSSGTLDAWRAAP